MTKENVKETVGKETKGGSKELFYFSVFKRGMRGVYQHCDEKHLHRYLAEFDFRHNNRVALGTGDVSRAAAILDGIVGKRLTYQTTAGR